MVNKKISIVIPSFNEGKNIQELYRRLRRVLDPLVRAYEIIFVNNGSTDDSGAILETLAEKDKRVVALFLSRNFGSQGAHSAGLSVAAGDAVVCMDGDLQDPPELISRFVEKWSEGYDVVYGIRKRRKGSILKRIGYKIFYQLLNKYSYINIPLDTGDFALMDRKVVDVVNSSPEKDRFIRGIRAYAGFRQTGVEYVREKRFFGKAKYGFFDNVIMAYKWFFSFSYTPLELISYFALAVSALALAGMGFYLYRYFAFRDAPHGFATLITVILFLGAIQLLSISIIGGYISRIFEEVKNRPSFIISRMINRGKKGSKK